MTAREANAAKALALANRGLFYREIAERMGVSKGTVRDWLYDPDGTKLRARKDTLRKPCIDGCGRMVSGSDPGRSQGRCPHCATARASTRRKASGRKVILAAIKEWVSIHGEPPAVADWHPNYARQLGDWERARRCEREGWPCHTTVYHLFGSWNVALEAAGYAPRAAHGGNGNQLRKRRLREAA